MEDEFVKLCSTGQLEEAKKMLEENLLVLLQFVEYT